MIDRLRKLLTDLELQDKIKIAFDEWNLRGWYHPQIHCENPGYTKEDYLYPRDLNDKNSSYTMADAVFSACFLNTSNRNNDIIKMANLAPTVNTRGCIYTYDQGIVLRSTYYVFDLYVNEMGREVINTVQTDIPLYSFRKKDGGTVLLPQSDILTTFSEEKKQICISVVNKAPDQTLEVTLNISDTITCDVFRILTLDGNSPDSYNDIDRQEVYIKYGEWSDWKSHASLIFPPHSVNIIQIKIV